MQRWHDLVAFQGQQCLNSRWRTLKLKKKKEYSSWLAARVSEQERKYCLLDILSVHPSTARIFLDSLIRGGTQDRSGYKSDFLFFNKYWFLQLSYCKPTTLVMLDALTSELMLPVAWIQLKFTAGLGNSMWRKLLSGTCFHIYRTAYFCLWPRHPLSFGGFFKPI